MPCYFQSSARASCSSRPQFCYSSFHRMPILLTTVPHNQRHMISNHLETPLLATPRYACLAPLDALWTHPCTSSGLLGVPMPPTVSPQER
eukprot:6470386-Amphidinium_carterae.2